MGEQILVRVSYRVVRAGSWAKVKSGEQGEGLVRARLVRLRVRVRARVRVRLRVMLRVRVNLGNGLDRAERDGGRVDEACGIGATG